MVECPRHLSTLWSARELLAFAHSRSAEFDVANVITNLQHGSMEQGLVFLWGAGFGGLKLQAVVNIRRSLM